MGASQGALEVKNPLASAGDIRDTALILELGRFPGERHGNTVWYSCLDNPMGFPHSSVGKESACNAGDPYLIPGLESTREGIGYPLQYSVLENSMDSIVHGVAELDATE